MIPITGGGAFSRQNILDINANFASIQNVDVFVDPQNGNNGDNGLSSGSPKSSIAGFASILEPGIRIGIRGVLFEEYAGPNVAGVSLIGLGNVPLQGTTSGAPNGGGATWLSPSGGTGTLLTVKGQGWRVQNIYFNNSATGATTSDIQILTTGDPPLSADGAHILIDGCIFTGANFGVYASGGTNWVNITNSRFFNFTGSGDTAIKTVAGAGVGTLLGWNVVNNTFFNNVHSVVVPSQSGFYIGNNFVSVGASVTATTLLSLTGGTGNTIYNNKFGLDSNAAGIGTIVAMGTTPNAGPNYYNEQAEYGQPA